MFTIAVVLLLLIAAPTTDKHALPEPRPHRGAIVANGIECAAIMRRMIDAGGSAADAIIAGLLCEGVASPQSTGLGGGFVATIYRKETNQVDTLIARDVAPLAATEDMFVDKSITGGISISVPGELKGYWELHQRYGKLKWSQLFDPVIELCRNGFTMTSYIAAILKALRKKVLASPTLSEVFINPKTNDVYQTGDLVKRKKLAETLEFIKNEGVAAIYNNGTIAQMLVQDIQEAGGIVTVEDLMQYNVRWEKPISLKTRNNKTLYTLPLPGSGALVTFIMNLLTDYLPHEESTLALHRIVEASKFAYAKRSELGDYRFVESVSKVIQNLTDLNFASEIRKKIDDYQTHADPKYYGANFAAKDDHGTAHINVIAPNGDAIAATGSIQKLFGCKIISSRTGIILNSGMDDFSTPGRENKYGAPPSPANFIAPQKMPLSSMCPTILVDQNGDAELLLGAAGGPKIITAIAYVLLRYLYFNETLTQALHARRLYNVLFPMELVCDFGFRQSIIDGLEKNGHKMILSPPNEIYTAVTAICRADNRIIPVFEPVRSGSFEVIA